MRPVSSHLRGDHSRHVENRVENLSLTPSRTTGTVKWTTGQKNFTYLTLSDGREAFLHRDDFDGDWPPRYLHTVEFTLIENNHPKCKWRAKYAKPARAR